MDRVKTMGVDSNKDMEEVGASAAALALPGCYSKAESGRFTRVAMGWGRRRKSLVFHV